MNSCTVIAELVAGIELPGDARRQPWRNDPTLKHLRTIPLAISPGRYRTADASWGRSPTMTGAGEAKRDHSFTTLVRFDDQWRPYESGLPGGRAERLA
jgi:hypothetical protein